MKTVPTGISTIVMLAAAVSTAAAREMPEQFPYVGAHASRYQIEEGSFGDDFIEDVSTPGLQAGFRFSGDLSLQAWWNHNNTRYEESGRKADFNLIMASMRRHMGFISRRWEPYAGLGAGELTIETAADDNDESFLSLELGVQRRIRPHWIIDIGARAPYSVDNERWDREYYLALNHAFGVAADATVEKEPSPLVVPQPTLRDTDRDGVPDTVDECPGTPRGSRVDSTGCPAAAMEEAP